VVAYYPPVCFRSIQDYRLAVHSRSTDGRLSGISEWVAEALMRGLMGAGSGGSECESGYPDFVAALLGGNPEECPSTYDLLSPISHVSSRCPPTLLLQGTDDCLGLAPGVRRLHRALREAGTAVVLAEFPHADHAFDLILPQLSPLAQAATSDVERFLDLLVGW
jgi:acetyl esterase/lipase